MAASILSTSNNPLRLSLDNFFHYYIYAPNSLLLSPDERTKAWALSCFFTFCTASLAPRICRHFFLAEVLKSREIKTDYFHQVISETRDPGIVKSRTRKLSPCAQIIDGLFLGDSRAFVQTTGFSCYDHDSDGRPTLPINTSNPHGFTKVMTFCVLSNIGGDFTDLAGRTAGDYRTALLAKKIEWNFIGKMVMDDPTGWKPLVYDCTFLGTELAERDFPRGGATQEQLNAIYAEKTRVVDTIEVRNWFEPIFRKMDTAVFGTDKVLAHCQAGRSRSASVVAAYLINRFHVTSEQAIAYLRSKRRCVDPKFANELDGYAKALAASI